MSDRVTFFYRQKVTEAELNGAFADLEAADFHIMTDLGLVGVVSGLAVSENTPEDQSVNVTTGVAYSPSGRRMYLPTTQNVSIATDFTNASTAVTTPGNQRIVSLFLRATRANSDPRVDGNGSNVFFNNDESVGFYVKVGVESVGPLSPPALEADKILLCDITRSHNDNTIDTADVSFTRTQIAPLVQGLAAKYAAHVAGGADRHAATAIDYAGSPAFADATALAAGTVEASLDALVTAIAGTTGSAKMGAALFTAPNSFYSLVAGTVQSQLRAIATWLDNPVIFPLRSASASFSVVTGDGKYLHLVNTTGGALNVQLPNPANNVGRVLEFKDVAGTFGINACTLVRFGSEKIEGLNASRVLSAAWGHYMLFSNGTDWFMGN